MQYVTNAVVVIMQRGIMEVDRKHLRIDTYPDGILMMYFRVKSLHDH